MECTQLFRTFGWIRQSQKPIKMGQIILNGVAALYNWEQTALAWIERIPMKFG